MSLKSIFVLRIFSRFYRIIVNFIITFVIINSAYSKDNSTEWSDWMPLRETGISWRYHCDDKPINGKYRAYFEFSRSDPISKRIGAKTYAHVRLNFKGYSSAVRVSFHTDYKKDWRYMPYPLVKDNLNFTSRVRYSQYRKQPRVWSDKN